MLLFLTVLACSTPEAVVDGREIGTPPDVPVPTAKREVPLPEGHAVSRECFAGPSREHRSLGARGSGAGGGGTGGVSPGTGSGSGYGSGKKSTRPPAPKGPPAPSATAAAQGAKPDPVAANTTPAPAAASPAPPSAAATPAPLGAAEAPAPAPAVAASEPAAKSVPAEQKAAAGPSLDEGAGTEAAGAGLADASSSDGITAGELANDRPPAAEEEAKPRTRRAKEATPADVLEARRRARLDWGATTWLSNDDSMSLASAQRLLWAIQNRQPVTTAEVRPHELLNYFSFDTVDVAPGDTFSVFGTAEPIGDGKLGLALAIKGVVPERRPLDLTLVLDRSGSMWDEGRMDYLKRGLRTMQGRLVRGDRVDVVLFDHEVCTPLENYVVGRDDPALFDTVLTRLEPRGSTDLDAGLTEGYRIANARTDVEGRNRRMLLISDALLNEGEMDPAVVSEIGRAYQNAGIRLSAIGVGRTFNDKVLDMISEKGQGAYVYLGSEAVVDRIFGPGFDSLTETVANDVHFGLDLPDSLAIERFYGEESSTVKADVQPIDYYAGTTQLFLQDVAMRDAEPVASDRIVLNLEWTDPLTHAPRTAQKSFTVGELVHNDPRNLRKGRALMAWTDLVLARTLGNDPCAAPYTTWDGRVRDVGPDAELAWLDGLTAPLCGRESVASTMVPKPGVPLKVRIDADQVIAEIGLQCGGNRQTTALSGNVAVFSAEPGSCELLLQGAVPMTARVEVPKTGGDVRCVLRGGKLSCG